MPPIIYRLQRLHKNPPNQARSKRIAHVSQIGHIMD